MDDDLLRAARTIRRSSQLSEFLAKELEEGSIAFLRNSLYAISENTRAKLQKALAAGRHRGFMWQTLRGKSFAIRDLEDSHLQNILRLLTERLETEPSRLYTGLSQIELQRAMLREAKHRRLVFCEKEGCRSNPGRGEILCFGHKQGAHFWCED